MYCVHCLMLNERISKQNKPTVVVYFWYIHVLIDCVFLYSTVDMSFVKIVPLSSTLSNIRRVIMKPLVLLNVILFTCNIVYIF